MSFNFHLSLFTFHFSPFTFHLSQFPTAKLVLFCRISKPLNMFYGIKVRKVRNPILIFSTLRQNPPEKKYVFSTSFSPAFGSFYVLFPALFRPCCPVSGAILISLCSNDSFRRPSSVRSALSVHFSRIIARVTVSVYLSPMYRRVLCPPPSLFACCQP